MNCFLDVLCTIITTIATIVALFLSVRQIKLSNKQLLFERRLKIYLLAVSFISLCKEHYNLLSPKEKERPQFAIDQTFLWLTNNSYMEKHANAIQNPLKQPFHKEFLSKCEALKKAALEAQVIFEGEVASAYSDFILAYEATLFSIYQYQIIINQMMEKNEKKPMTIEEAQKLVPEEEERKKVLSDLKNLLNTYHKVSSTDISRQAKRQLMLT